MKNETLAERFTRPNVLTLSKFMCLVGMVFIVILGILATVVHVQQGVEKTGWAMAFGPCLMIAGAVGFHIIRKHKFPVK